MQVDTDQIQRVVVNLIDNAVAALEAKTGGIAPAVICVETQLDATNGVARVIVSDNGPGISESDREKLFLPYFSTKGRGSGLGLAIVRRIVIEHGGSIDVTDNVPSGTRFNGGIAVRSAIAGRIDRGGRDGERGRVRPTVLVVDDEAGVRSALKGVLGDEGYLVEVVDSGEACLEQVTGRVFDLIILDIWLPGLDGLETLTLLRKRAVETQVVMISGHGSIEAAVRAIKLGAFDFLEKPLSLDKTVLVVRNALRQRRLEVENRALRAAVDRRQVMVGDSQVMVQLRKQIEMAAPTNGRVLIQGENGTGKELVARSVHALSLRSEGSFVEVNCAAIPEETDRERAVRSCARRLHRRGQRPAGQVRARRRRARSFSMKSAT